MRPAIQQCAGRLSLSNPTCPDLTPTPASPGYRAACSQLRPRLQSYWVVQINLDTYKTSKRQIAPLIPKCLLPSAATSSCWDLHNE